ncbi:integumentary mucin C.1-like [Cloeon dipterum]|uniref:integumentary mucin C.1-like n=1 Tax=Cloeon dipterum TaxID=197152 RepID=UPI0032204660
MTKKPVKKTTAALKTKNNAKSKGVKSPAKQKPANKKVANPKHNGLKTTKRAATTQTQKRVQLHTTASKKNVAVEKTTSVKTDFKSSAKPITIKQTTKTTTIDVAKLLNDLKSFNQVESKTTSAQTTTTSESTSMSPSTPSGVEVGPILTIQQTLFKEPTFSDTEDYYSQLIPKSEVGQSVPLKVAEQGIAPLSISATFFDAADQFTALLTTTSTTTPIPSTTETNSSHVTSTTTSIPTTTLTSPITTVQPLTTTTRPTTTTTTTQTTTTTTLTTSTSPTTTKPLTTTTPTTIQRTTICSIRPKTTVKASFQAPMLVFAKIALPIAMAVNDTTTSSTSTVGFDANIGIVEFPNGTESPTALLAYN